MAGEISGRDVVLRLARRGLRWLLVGGLLTSSACVAASSDPSPKLADASRTSVAVADEQYDKSHFGSYLAGRFAEKRSDLVAAADLMKRVVEDDPKNEHLLRRAFILFLGSGQYDTALKFAELLAEREAGTTVSLLLLAARSVKAGQFEDAKKSLKDLPTQGLAKYSRPIAAAWIGAGLKEYTAAVKSLEPLSKESGFGSLTNLHLALLYELAGKPDDAMAVYTKATEDMDKAPLRMVRAMGAFLERRGETVQARQVYETYLKVHPTSHLMTSEKNRLEAGNAPAPIAVDAAAGFAEGMFNLASALPLRRAGVAALLYVRLATYLKPEFPVAQLLMGDILDQSDRHADSIAIYQNIALDSPYSWLARLKMAANLDHIDRIDEAKALLEKMAEERPTEIEPLVRLGSFLRVRENFAGAEQAYNRAFQRLHEVTPNYWSLYYYRGISRERQKKWSEAERDFLKALELNPDQPYVLNYLGYSWVDQGVNLDRAKAMIERAVEQRRDDGYIVDSMGWVLYQLGAYGKAVHHLERAVELRPLDPIISDHLGDAYWRVGRRQEARFQWRRALSLNPEKKEIGKIETKIENGLAPSEKKSGSGG
mgnify:CR=1 FL=1